MRAVESELVIVVEFESVKKHPIPEGMNILYTFFGFSNRNELVESELNFLGTDYSALNMMNFNNA